MKKRMPIQQSFKMLSFLFAAIMVVACAEKITFPTSNVLPAAEAEVKVEKNDNSNFELELKINNLAEPSRLSPPRKTYLVWMVTERNGTIKIGNLDVERDNEASLQTTTPFKPVRIFVTAEDDQNAEVPSTQIVLDSNEFRIDS